VGITTYPEMNDQIKDILKFSANPASLYAAQRIEELEKANRLLVEREKKLVDALKEIAWWQYPGRLMAEEALNDIGISESEQH